MRVAIVGATGMLSQHTLAAAAAAGHDVVAVDATAIAVMSAGQFVNGAKARSELGFTATETLDNAIRLALAWFRSNGCVKPN